MVTQASFSDQNLTTQKTVARWTDAEEFIVQSDALYFIADGAGHIKIGRAKNPNDRLKTLRSGNARNLQIIRFVENAGWQEPIWHSVLRSFWVRGEWFADTQPIRAAIALADADDERWCYALPVPAIAEDIAFTPEEVRAFAAIHQMTLEDARSELWGSYVTDLMTNELRKFVTVPYRAELAGAAQ